MDCPPEQIEIPSRRPSPAEFQIEVSNPGKTINISLARSDIDDLKARDKEIGGGQGVPMGMFYPSDGENAARSEER